MTRNPLTDLPRRARLTVQEYGWGNLLLRVLTAPLRPFGLDKGVRRKLAERGKARASERWYRANGRPAVVVIPTYGDPGLVLAAVRAVRKTTDAARVRVVVVDDASPAEDQRRLREELKDAELIVAPENAGYAAAVNLGIERSRPDEDVVVLNSDVIAHPHWLARLQEAVHDEQEIGIAGPRLLYDDGRIQSGGSYRNVAAPEWFDHRYRFRAADFGPAQIDTNVIAVTGAAMYVKRDLLDQIGGMDEGYAMGYEDVDWCLRAWEAGRSVRYAAAPVMTHLESPTRGTDVGERERSSQQRFWDRWGAFFDDRPVRTESGALRVIYVTEDTGVGGGHRDIFEHLNRLKQRGHDVSLYSLGGQPEWFPLDVQVRSFEDYDQLAAALGEQDAIKIATWWVTGAAVWRGSLERGRPVFFVQDIETSYYAGRDAVQERMRNAVLSGYREEFRYMTISERSVQELAKLNLQSELVPPGIDLDTFKQIDIPRRQDMVLALGRSNPLKNFPLTVDAWKRVGSNPELRLFGVEPELTPEGNSTYVERPSDEGVNELLNQATVFVQTSVHEGFCLPPLEAMAAGAPVVCTDANGNRDFCVHEQNCLMVDPDPASVAAGIERVLGDAELRERLVAGGLETVKEYAWERRIEQLERFLDDVADERPQVSGALPGERVGEDG